MLSLGLVYAGLLGACSKADDPGVPVEEAEDCRVSVLQHDVVNEEQAIVTLLVENTSEQDLSITVTAEYLLDEIVVAEGGGNYSSIAEGEQARFRIRPSVPLGPEGFDCVRYETRTQRVGARTVRLCPEFDSCE